MHSESQKARWHSVYRCVIYTWECDFNGHLNVRYFLPKFDEGGDHLMLMSGVPLPDLRRRGFALVAAKHEVTYRAQVREGTLVHILGAVAAVGNSSAKLAMKMLDAHGGSLLATCMGVVVLVDQASGKPVAWPSDYRPALSSQILSLAPEDAAIFGCRPN
jgi:acyl-CoA thioester hydrolase